MLLSVRQNGRARENSWLLIERLTIIAREKDRRWNLETLFSRVEISEYHGIYWVELWGYLLDVQQRKAKHNLIVWAQFEKIPRSGGLRLLRQWWKSNCVKKRSLLSLHLKKRDRYIHARSAELCWRDSYDKGSFLVRSENDTLVNECKFEKTWWKNKKIACRTESTTDVRTSLATPWVTCD